MDNAVECKVDQTILSLLDKFPYKPMPAPSHYEEVRQLMNSHVWTEIFPYTPTADPLAYVTRAKGNDGVYEVYVNPYVTDDLRQYLLLHEFGHILFTHMEMELIQEDFLIKKITSYWPVIKKFFYKSPVLNQYDLKEFAHTILNIAQDLEINGKLYTNEEWTVFQHNIQAGYISATVHDPNTSAATKAELIKWLSLPEYKREPLFVGWHPKNFNFPAGLDYVQYVDMFILNNELFFPQLTSQIKKSVLLKSNSFSEGKLTTQEINRLRKQSRDTNNIHTSLYEKAIGEREAWNGTSGFSATGKVQVKKNKKHSTNGINKKKLENFIIEQCYNKSKANTHCDNMYYYNRKKYNSDLLISKNTKEELYKPGNLYLLVDCSGSISFDSIKIIIRTIQKIGKKLGKNSRIIWWDTDLAGNFLLRKPAGPESTGGTDIAKGIEYVRNNYLKNNNDKLIIISDFEDSLVHWYEQLSQINKNDCFGICWKYGSNVYSSIGNFLEQRSYNIDDKIIIPALLRKMPTTLVNIDYL